MIANRDGKDGGVRPNTYTITNLGWPPQLPFRRRPPANKRIIDEHSAVRNEAILPDRNQFADERVRLNPAPLTDSYAPLYLDEGSNEAAISDDATIQIDRLHHSDIFSESDIHDRGITDFWLRHDSIA